MSYEVKDNTIALFSNDKGDNAARPDFRGRIVIEGVKYRASLWVKESPTAGRYLQGSIEPDQPKEEAAAPAKAAPSKGKAKDTDPFF
jgi:hypothetical protein